MDYEKMLDRGLEETPDIAGGSDRFDVPEPDIRQEGHSTVFENFQSVVDKLDRPENHLLKFLQNYLGTSANIDESNRARLTGEFDTDRIAEAVEAYTEQYVLCSECGLPDTNLERQKGAEILQCDACGAQSST